VRPHFHCKRENRKILIRKWRCWHTKKVVNKLFVNHCWSAPPSPRLLLLSTQKRSVTRNCWNRAWPAGTRLLISTGKPNKHVTTNFWQNTWPTIKFHIPFSYLCSTVASKIYNFLKTSHTTHMCGGREDHGCKNLAHTSKTRQVKRLKLLQLLGSRFACLLLFQTGKNRMQRNRRPKGCGV